MTEIPSGTIRLLLVNDDNLQRCSIHRALRYRHRPLYICEACSIAEAEKAIAGHEFDIVLTSLHLHDGDADAILKLASQLQEHRPAVVIVGHEEDEAMDEDCICSGAQAFLVSEEIQPSTLFSLIRQARQHALLQQQTRDLLLQLQDQAEHDALTRLFNRHVFDEHLRACLARGERHDKPFALVMIDLDEFKQVNDHWGHCTGDAVLQEAAQRIATACRESDIACRIGGDEFAVLLPDISDEREPSILAERLAEVLRQPLHAGDGNFYIRASIGIARYPEHGRTALDLMSYADRAMYCSKQQQQQRPVGQHQPVASQQHPG